MKRFKSFRFVYFFALLSQSLVYSVYLASYEQMDDDQKSITS